MSRRSSTSTTDEEEVHHLDSINHPEAPKNSSTIIPNPPQSSTTPQPKKQSRAKRKNSRPADLKNAAAWNQQSPSTSPASASDGKELHLQITARDISPTETTDTTNMARRVRMRNPWAFSWLAIATLTTATALLLCLYQSFATKQLDPKGGSMSYMASSFVQFEDFDTEHTRFATKYSLHLYRELGVDEDPRVKGVPVLFIPGNAGSYKQVRSLASEAEYFREATGNHYIDGTQEKLALDFFTVDFNEDFTAFHGQTLLDQAEYLNDAIAYILALYHNPEKSRRASRLPDPSSVILVGHSMGGVVARTMLTMQNYQASSVNTIVTLSAPHARPPVTFDAQIVDTYKNINDYWRKAHSKEWGMDNPLWHVTVISIAGGGLDTIVPSDYASISSLIPETHGFTVFTSTIPSVWTGMDHLAITWCDEFRKSVIKALFDVIDVSRPSQTKPRGERMRVFKRWFLTGLEDITEKQLPNTDPSALLTLEDSANNVLAQGERLILKQIGYSEKRSAHFLPIPPQGVSEGRKFTLLTSIDRIDAESNVDILFCSVFPLQAGHSASLLNMNMELSGETPKAGSTKLACKSAAADFVNLPASTSHSQYAFDKERPFSYLQYDLETLAELQFVVVVEKPHMPSQDFIVAEFSSRSDSQIISHASIQQLFESSLHWSLPADRPLVTDIKVPALESSLLSYHLSISSNPCGKFGGLFRPLVRQYISDVYESKFFVNVEQADINIHGVAPYMPPSMRAKDGNHGIAFQIWSDPTCREPVRISLSLDIIGSFGKLWMRYRTLFATLPLFIVAIVMARQFRVYDETGVFMSFAEGMNQCIRKELPIILALTVSATMLFLKPPSNNKQPVPIDNWFDKHRGNATESLSDFTMNNLLIGSPDPFFWFLIPIFGIISTGLCIAINYAILLITYTLMIPASYLRFFSKQEDPRRPSGGSFTITSTKQRIITTSVLLGLVATVLPYQFAYLVLCIVQIVTAIRALRLLRDTRTDYMYNFYNYSHSLLVLMLWILPINLPVLVVWIRNLALHWLTPFSTHHNILSIVPFILLVETGATGKMVPPLPSRIRYITTTILAALAFYAALYGVSYAFTLHQVADVFCAWLVLVLWFTGSWELERVIGTVVSGTDDSHNKKRP